MLACGLVAALAVGGCRAVDAGSGPAGSGVTAVPVPADPLGGVDATLDQLERDLTAVG